ncbi:hypothetical protein AB38_2616 [Escherichia coli 1-110-08_S1_C2]|nr:hypothetical protein AB38_2616 [Escherichia coli 1-110-08_S1_C2]
MHITNIITISKITFQRFMISPHFVAKPCSSLFDYKILPIKLWIK